MVDKMLVLELMALAVVLYSPCVSAQKSAQDIPPYQTFSCYIDHCNVDKQEFCSDREKRCISCTQHMGDCRNPEKAPRMPRECIIYCRKYLHEKEVRQEYEERMEKAAQACKDKMGEMQQNTYANEGLETSTKQYQTGCPPPFEHWVVTLVVIVAALGWGILIYMGVRSCSSSRRDKRQGTSPATRGNPQDEECRVEMTGQSNGDLKTTDGASSGFGSKSTTFTKSKDSGVGELRIERETARQTIPFSLRNPRDMERGLPSDFIHMVEKTENGSEQPQSRGHQLRRQQQPLRQQGEQQQEEEEQRLLGQQQEQQGDEDQQQQQRLCDRYGLQSPQGSVADMGEISTDVWQPQHGYQYRRGVPPESDSCIHRSFSGHGASSGCLANAGTSPQASGQCQSQPACSPTTCKACKAYEKLTQVNPTNNT